MCLSGTEWTQPSRLYCSLPRKGLKQSKVRIYGLIRRKRTEKDGDGKDMKLKNFKLYMENMSILEENAKLRKKAHILHEENLALMSELQQKFSHIDRMSITLFLLSHSQR